METSRWDAAQENELAVWQHTVDDVANVLAEITETADLVRFGNEHGLNACTTVIELGIGPMGIGWAAFSSATTAVGVDPLPRLTVTTGDRNVDQFVAGLQRKSEFLRADATTKLPFDDRTFGLVVCENVVDHTQDPSAILSEGRRIVRSDGRMLFGVNVFSSLGHLKWRHLTCRLHPQDINVLCHPHSFVEGDLDRLLTRAGWRIVAIDGKRGIKERLFGHSYRVRLVAEPI
jgi:SAM-dependent methyltransferase